MQCGISVQDRISNSRGRTLRVLLSVVALAGILLGYVGHRRAVDPDLPLWPASSGKNRGMLSHDGRPVSANQIHRIEIAGLRLGMPVKDAVARLRKISLEVKMRPHPSMATPQAVMGRSAWTELAYGSSIDPKALGLLRTLPIPNSIALGSSTWPDGQERLTSIALQVQALPSNEERKHHPGRDLMLELTSALRKRLGPPTVRGRDFYGEDIVVYGSEPKRLMSVPGLFMYHNCTSFGAPVSDPSFTCDRRRAIRTPWLDVLGGTYAVTLHLQDGAAAYASRYPAGYKQSRPYLVY